MVQEFYLTKKRLEEIKKEYEILKEIRLAKTKGEAPKVLESEDLNPEYLSFREDLNLLDGFLEVFFKRIPSEDPEEIIDF